MTPDPSLPLPPGEGRGEGGLPAPAPARVPEPEPAPAPSRLRRAGEWLRDRIANPIVTIELQAAFRRKRFLLAFSLSLLVTAIVLISVVATVSGERNAQPAEIGQALFAAFVITQAIVIGLLFPAFSATSITEERIQKSIDLLLTTNLRPWEIIAGKFLGAFVYCATFLAATLPLVATAFLFGGVTPRSIVALYVLMTLDAAIVSMVGTFVSAASNTLLRSVVGTYLVVAALAFPLAWLEMVPGNFDLGDSLGLSHWEIDEMKRAVVEFLPHLWTGIAASFLYLFAFFAVVGTNRLKPPAYNKATSVRIFFLLLCSGMAAIFAWIAYDGRFHVRRLLWQVETTYYAVLFALISAAAILFIGTAVFATEPTEGSLRIGRAAARLARWNPVRLLLPGPGRGASFALLVAALLVGGLGFFALDTLELRDHVAERGHRGDLAVRDVALVILSFLAFVAALGVFCVQRIGGQTAPRVALVSVMALLAVAPVLVFISERHARGEESVAIRNGYFLAPIMAGISAWHCAWTDAEGRAIGYIRTEVPADLEREAIAAYADAFESDRGHRRATTPPLKPARPYSSYEALVRMEWALIPLHYVTICLYGALAVVFALASALRWRKLRRGPELAVHATEGP